MSSKEGWHIRTHAHLSSRRQVLWKGVGLEIEKDVWWKSEQNRRKQHEHRSTELQYICRQLLFITILTRYYLLSILFRSFISYMGDPTVRIAAWGSLIIAVKSVTESNIPRFVILIKTTLKLVICKNTGEVVQLRQNHRPGYSVEHIGLSLPPILPYFLRPISPELNHNSRNST